MKDLRSKLLEAKNTFEIKKEFSAPLTVEHATSKRNGNGKGTNIYLLSGDNQKIDELDLFLRHQGVKTNRSIIMRAGLATLKPNQDLVDKVRALIKNDARRTP